MTKLNLGIEGKFFSGRSRAAELVDQFVGSQPSLPIVIDFSGVESTSQSFISELLVRLKDRGIDLNAVQFTSVSDKEVDDRIRREVQRLVELRAS